MIQKTPWISWYTSFRSKISSNSEIYLINLQAIIKSKLTFSLTANKLASRKTSTFKTFSFHSQKSKRRWNIVGWKDRLLRSICRIGTQISLGRDFLHSSKTNFKVSIESTLLASSKSSLISSTQAQNSTKSSFSQFSPNKTSAEFVSTTFSSWSNSTSRETAIFSLRS